MLKQILRTGALMLMAGALAGLPLQLSAQTSTNKPGATKAPAAAKKAQSHPFSGKLAALEKAAKTITVGKSVYQVTSETRIYKADRKTAAVFDDLVVGEAITGYATQGDDGGWTAKSVYMTVGADTKAAPAPAPKGK